MNATVYRSTVSLLPQVSHSHSHPSYYSHSGSSQVSQRFPLWTQQCTGLQYLSSLRSLTVIVIPHTIVTQGYHSSSLEVIPQSHSRSFKVSQGLWTLWTTACSQIQKHGTCMCGCVSVCERTRVVRNYARSLIVVLGRSLIVLFQINYQNYES